MIDLHPPLSGYPLAFLSAVAALELILVVRPNERLRGAVTVIVWLLVVGTIAAFVSGLLASRDVQGSFHGTPIVVPESAIAAHYNAARVVLALVLVLAAFYAAAVSARFNRSIFQWLYRLALVSALVFVSYVGWLGGGLVFKHGAGVAIPSTAPSAPVAVSR